MGFCHFAGYLSFPFLWFVMPLHSVYLQVNPLNMLAQGLSKLTSYLQLTSHHPRCIPTTLLNLCSIL